MRNKILGSKQFKRLETFVKSDITEQELPEGKTDSKCMWEERERERENKIKSNNLCV